MELISLNEEKHYKNYTRKFWQILFVFKPKCVDLMFDVSNIFLCFTFNITFKILLDSIVFDHLLDGQVTKQLK